VGDVARDVIGPLVELSRALGDPARDCAILAEGNTSAAAGDGTFWVKASGRSLRDAAPESFVRVDAARALALLEGDDLDDEGVRRGLAGAQVDATGDVRPSVETVMHAALLELEGVAWAGHTHPTSVNAITCSRHFAEALAGRLFPDEIVLCGPEPMLVPYIDPGLPLAREIRSRLLEHVRSHGEPPRVVYMQSHGFIALGATAKQVLDTTDMAVKAARILLGTYALGGPTFLTPRDVARIHHRPDEHYRQRVLGMGQHEASTGPSSSPGCTATS
jgi:rhamnose utilization protein RhaD (predicted bifunctional aldolase and dehydrogenase)